MRKVLAPDLRQGVENGFARSMWAGCFGYADFQERRKRVSDPAVAVVVGLADLFRKGGNLVPKGGSGGHLQGPGLFVFGNFRFGLSRLMGSSNRYKDSILQGDIHTYLAFGSQVIHLRMTGILRRVPVCVSHLCPPQFLPIELCFGCCFPGSESPISALCCYTDRSFVSLACGIRALQDHVFVLFLVNRVAQPGFDSV